MGTRRHRSDLLQRHFWSQRNSDQFLDAYDAGTGGGLFGNGSAGCELHGGSFIDLCGLGTLMPEEETESPEEVRSQCRRSLPNVDE
jgi:hypothetical protein